jgi:hypothetical protein
MKAVFICRVTSVDTEITEYEETLQTSTSKLQGNFKLQSSNRALDLAVLIGLPVIVGLFRNQLAAWIYMWAIAYAIYVSCKWMTWRRTAGSLTWQKSLCYFFLWPGMDPEPFGSPALPGIADAGRWVRGARNIAAGTALVCSAVYLSHGNQSLWVGWLGMIGTVLLLHFGIFDLLAVAWNKAGVRVKPVMQAPIRATSVGDFWGRRWNTAFNDLAFGLVFRPLVRVFGERASRVNSGGSKGSIVPSGLWQSSKRLPNVETLGHSQLSLRDKTQKDFAMGTRGYTALERRRGGMAVATLCAFGISGVVHELVISMPAGGGYGLPTAYFVLQGLGVLLERSRVGRRIGLGRGVRGWLFTVACTAGPAFWLFHPTFVRNAILPMLRAFGGN